MNRKIKILAALFIAMLICISTVYGYSYDDQNKDNVEQKITANEPKDKNALKIKQTDKGKSVKQGGSPLDPSQIKTHKETNKIVLKLKDINDVKKLNLSEEISSKYDNMNTVTIEVPQGSDPDKIIAKYKKNATVEEAYIDETVKLYFTPTDPFYSQYQWNLQRIKMESAWDISRGDPSVVVAVIDTGYGPFPDVDGFINGVDTSGSVILEDTYPGEYSYEGSIHGTAVTSLIASNINTTGIAGIVPNIAIMPVKVFADGQNQTGSTQIAAGIRWAADHGADFINLSIGSNQGTYALEEATNYAINKGVMIIAASGNEAFANYISYPAAYNGVIAVGSTGKNDGVSSFSNEGDALDLVAPGEYIYLAKYPNSYSSNNGTSFSSPTVCAIAALVKSKYPSYGNDLIKTILFTGADDIMQSGWDKSSGHGIINAQKVMSIAADYSLIDVTVTFDTQGAAAPIETRQVSNNTLIAPPTEPTREGYAFGGWYKEASCINAWNFATDKVIGNITLYAKWTINMASGVNYQTHVQDIGWQEWKSNGEMSGTSGKGLRLEGINIKLSGLPTGMGIRYQTHIQNEGWQAWKYNGEMSGTSGKGLRLEGIKIELVNAPIGYHVEYRVHVQDYGWQGWKRDGAMAGTSGESKRLEGIEIKVVKDKDIGVSYQTHVQQEGWQSWKFDGEMSGTSGKSYRLEAINIKLTNAPAGMSIRYRTHVQNIGWQGWKYNGQMSGTTGKSLRLEGIEIQLQGAPAGYHVEYRVHVQDYGWQAWKRDGEMAGTSGESKRLEAIEIRITKN